MKKSPEEIIAATNNWLASLAESKALQGPPLATDYPMPISKLLSNLFRKRSEGWPGSQDKKGTGSAGSFWQVPKARRKKTNP